MVNGSSVLQLEINKAAQQILLGAAGIATPETVVAIGRNEILDAATALDITPFFVKPNQGGKGLGVQLFDSVEELENTLEAGGVSDAIDDVWLVQEKIETNDDFITRVEFVGGKFHYAVRVYSGGSFELCPADACNVDFEEFCPADANEAPADTGPRFEIDRGFDDPLIGKLELFLSQNGIEIAGVEFIRRPDGTAVVYDVNTNTNYNAGAEERAEIEFGGMQKIAGFLTDELWQVTGDRELDQAV